MAISGEWLQLLRKIFLFSTYTGSQLTAVAKKMSLVSYPKGAVLFREGDSGDSFFLVLSGSVRVTQNSTEGRRKDDSEIVLAYLTHGDAMGEMSVLAGEPRPYTAVVEATSEFLVLTKSDFNTLLEKDPAMAVHLSRILSNRLASFQKGGGVVSHPTKIFSLITALPVSDRVIFSVNLGLSTVEQTRKRVLLCVTEEEKSVTAKSIVHGAGVLSENAVQNGILRDPEKFREFVAIHPSGLEMITIPSLLFGGGIGGDLLNFMEMLKDLFDIVLFMIPTKFAGKLGTVIAESDRVLTITGPHCPPEEAVAVRKIETALAQGKKIERIWLSLPNTSPPPDIEPHIQIEWNEEWGRQFESQGSPFFSPHALAGQRSFDRLARNLGNLRVGFAMGSGAAFGYSLIGMLKVLEREGIYPDIISGTSMGALIGSFYAAGLTPDEMEAIAASITRKRIFFELMDINVGSLRTGVVGGKKVLDFLRLHLRDKTFRDLIFPFACVATDIQSGKEIVLDHGSVAEAVRASLSLPFFFQPFYLDGRYLVDGGLVNPVPTSIAVNLGANVIISANLTSKANERRVPGMIGWWRRRLPSLMRGPSIPETMIKTIYIMQYEIAAARAELAHVVMQIKRHDLLWWDLDHSREMIRMGEASAEEAIPKIKSLLPFFADSCKVRLRRDHRKNF